MMTKLLHYVGVFQKIRFFVKKGFPGKTQFLEFSPDRLLKDVLGVFGAKRVSRQTETYTVCSKTMEYTFVINTLFT